MVWLLAVMISVSSRMASVTGSDSAQRRVLVEVGQPAHRAQVRDARRLGAGAGRHVQPAGSPGGAWIGRRRREDPLRLQDGAPHVQRCVRQPVDQPAVATRGGVAGRAGHRQPHRSVGHARAYQPPNASRRVHPEPIPRRSRARRQRNPHVGGELSRVTRKRLTPQRQKRVVVQGSPVRRSRQRRGGRRQRRRRCTGGLVQLGCRDRLGPWVEHRQARPVAGTSRLVETQPQRGVGVPRVDD